MKKTYTLLLIATFLAGISLLFFRSELTNFYVNFKSFNETGNWFDPGQVFKNDTNLNGFIRYDKSFNDNGYLLIPRYSNKKKQSIIELFSLKERRAIYTWVPKIEQILKDATYNHLRKTNIPFRFLSQAPILLENKELIIQSGQGVLTRIDSCGTPLWISDLHHHHTTEIDSNGNFLVPVTLSSKGKLFFNNKTTQNDGYAVVSPSGKILETRSIIDILEKNGYRGLLYGVGKYDFDRTHLNDVQPVIKSGDILLKGDLLLSLRNLSTIVHYRPSTNKIISLKTGPWLNQHDINIIGKDKLSILGNDIVRFRKRNRIYLNQDKNSQFYIWDLSSGSIKTPYQNTIKELKLKTKVSGRLRILDDQDFIFEEHQTGRIIRGSKDSKKWAYVRLLPGTQLIYGNHMSRYITEQELPKDFFLRDSNCNN